MPSAASDNLANVNAGIGEDNQGIESSIRALKLSNPPALGDHAHDSGYGSATSTPDPKDTAIPLRKPGQIPLILQTGLHVSNKAMDLETRRRFHVVQLEIEKMLLEFLRKLKSGAGRYKPIAIRPMMLGKTDSDVDAKSYMVVICPENIKHRVQDFFDEPLVKSLCEPGEDNVPSFRALVIGHALRLRASGSDIAVQCDALEYFHDGTNTFCGMPIRLRDELGHSRKATFGGMVKITASDGNYQLYGLTAGHLIRDHQVVPDRDNSSMADIDGSDLADLELSEEAMDASVRRRGTSPTVNDNIDQDDLERWYFRNVHYLGDVLDEEGRRTLVDEDPTQMRPYLDWALFDLNAHRPNQLVFVGPGHPKGDLHLPSSHSRKDEIPVSMLCATRKVKRGMLSTTRARVLLEPGESFTDAYTLTLDDSQVSDGDSGSWVVDELRLEVYGHVVADDVFGDAYIIPMDDILADIKYSFDAKSVELPSGLDVVLVSRAALKQPTLLAGPGPRDRQHSQAVEGRDEDSSHLPPDAEEWFLLSDEPLDADAFISSTGAPERLSSTFGSWPIGLPPQEMSFDPDPYHRFVSSSNPITELKGQLRHETHDSGYSSLFVTPHASAPTSPPDP